MTPNEAVEKLTDFVRGHTVYDLAHVLAALPNTVDPALVVTFFGRRADSPKFLASVCAKLPPPAIRAVLASLPSLPRNPDLVMWSVAVSAELADDALVAAWKRALAATQDLDTSYGWGSRKRRLKIAALARDPVILAAIQAAVAQAKEPSRDMLAVLVADGSVTSYDALVAHIATACEAADTRLDLLSKLRVHAARTPLLDALFAEIDGALQTRNDTSPALALGPLIGIGEPALLWFDAPIRSTQTLRGSAVQAIAGSIVIDSRRPVWFSVQVWRVGSPSSPFRPTQFTSDPAEGLRDELGIGRCEASELPRWLATVATKLAITWDTCEPRTHLRGAKKELLVRWLGSG